MPVVGGNSWHPHAESFADEKERRQISEIVSSFAFAVRSVCGKSMTTRNWVAIFPLLASLLHTSFIFGIFALFLCQFPHRIVFPNEERKASTSNSLNDYSFLTHFNSQRERKTEASRRKKNVSFID